MTLPVHFFIDKLEPKAHVLRSKHSHVDLEEIENVRDFNFKLTQPQNELPMERTTELTKVKRSKTK